MQQATPQPDQPQHLRDLVQRYEMAYHIVPEWGADVRWNQQKVGFAIELFALPNPAVPSDSQSPTERAGLHSSYAALREVLAWALGRGGQDVCVTIDDYENRVVLETRPSSWRTELIAHVTHCGDVRRPLDEREQRYVDEVKRRLASLGVREH